MTTARTLLGGAALLGAAFGGQTAAADPLGDARGAIVIVQSKGTDTLRGNQEVATQGTGFFISKDGYLVTSYHLISELGAGADPASVQFEIRPNVFASSGIPARQVYGSPSADVLVLYAPVGDLDEPVLKPADRSTADIKLSQTPIFTEGFPAGYGFATDTGFVKSFAGPINPLTPSWIVNVNFKAGQSGSPILLGDGRVVAIVKGVDEDAPTIGIVVPIRLIPHEYWDGQFPAATSRDDDTRIVVENTAPSVLPKPVVRPFSLANPPCAAGQRQSFAVAARAGWQIDPDSVDFGILNSTDSTARLGVDAKDAAHVVIGATLSNAAACATLFGVVLRPAIPAVLNGYVTYNEVPIAPAHTAETLIDAVASQTQTLVLPAGDRSGLKFTLVSHDRRIAFTPAADEIVAGPAGAASLNVAKVVARLVP